MTGSTTVVDGTIIAEQRHVELPSTPVRSHPPVNLQQFRGYVNPQGNAVILTGTVRLVLGQNRMWILLYRRETDDWAFHASTDHEPLLRQHIRHALREGRHVVVLRRIAENYRAIDQHIPTQDSNTDETETVMTTEKPAKPAKPAKTAKPAADKSATPTKFVLRLRDSKGTPQYLINKIRRIETGVEYDTTDQLPTARTWLTMHGANSFISKNLTIDGKGLFDLEEHPADIFAADTKKAKQ